MSEYLRLIVAFPTLPTNSVGDTWLRHYATSWKVAGSIPNENIEFFCWSNPSSRTVTLGSTQPLTEMSTTNLRGGKGRPARKDDHRTAICEPII
jgi:hypothetical protein